MFGIGVTELLIIAVIAVLLFGTPVLAFFLGYTVGKKSTAERPAQSGPSETDREELSE